MKKFIIVLFALVCSIALFSAPVTVARAKSLASVYTGMHNPSLHLTIMHDDIPLAYVFVDGNITLISADDTLPPVIAYGIEPGTMGSYEYEKWLNLIETDLYNRLQAQTPESQSKALLAWQKAENGRGRDFEQWPPEGYSPTGGWLKTNWTQSFPYNMYCPIDPVSGSRSLAGCPSVAMAMIVNYHQNLNGTRLNDNDDYYHNYAGRQYWIDNDYEAHGFASFPDLNSYLDELTEHYKYGTAITDSDKGALVWACGVAARQVYTSSGSGTFGVNQALMAFERFGFEGLELLQSSVPDKYERIAQNMMDALPVHLAVVTPAWDSGHNVVVDGYNTDEFFHLNFGWGGSYNGWYLLPSQIPYGLTVLEGAIVDIIPKSYLFVFPDAISITTHEELISITPIEIINTTQETLHLESLEHAPCINALYWGYYVSAAPHHFPIDLAPGQSLVLQLQTIFHLRDEIEYANTRFRLLHTHGFYDINVEVNVLLTPVEDEYIGVPPSIKAYPNPFSSSIRISGIDLSKAGTKVSVYDLRGRKVADLPTEKAKEIVWNGRSDKGKIMPKGIYLLKVDTPQSSIVKRILKK